MKTLTKIALAGLMASGIAMAKNDDGYKMSICSTDKSKLCYNGKEIFLNGMNIAWWNFGQDVGKDSKGKIMTLDENTIRKDLSSLRAAGGNSIRWWLYTNNAMDPSFDATTKYATGIEEQTIKNVGMVLDLAEEYGIVVDLCLLSFDMMKKSYSNDVSWGSRFNFEANELILKDEAATQAFIDKAVLPLVKAYKNHPALLAWEVFNEPEGMTSTDNFGDRWGTTLVDIKYIQRVINMTAHAIHTEAPNNLVSNGSARFIMTSDKCGTNYYTDTKLLASGENKYAKGTLDFYQVHYYPQWNMNAASPFHHPYSYFELDKPMVIGELPGADWDKIVHTSNDNLDEDPANSRQMTITDAYKYALNNGYSGALGWTLHEEAGGDFYNVTWSLAASSSALTAVYDLATDKVKLADYSASESGQNGWMKVTYNNVDGSKGANLEYGYTSSLAGVTNITFTVKNNSSMNLQYTMAAKTNDKDAAHPWGWYNANSYCNVKAGETATCTFPLSKFAFWEDKTPLESNLSNIAQVIIKMNTDKFTGEVLIDDVKADNTMINNFDTEFDTFSPESGTTTITKVETYFDGTPAKTTAIALKGVAQSSKVSVQGSTLLLTTANAGFTTLEVFNMAGKRIESLHRGTISAGTHAFSLRTLSKGQYVIRVKSAGMSATQQIVIK